MSDFRDEIRRAKPAKAQRADHGGSRSAAIELHCESCAGSVAEAGRCTAPKCFLWPFRPGAGGPNDARRVRPAGVVPTVEEYEVMRPQLTDEERAAIRARFVGECDADEQGDG